MSIKCRLFGHKLSPGYAGHPPYLRPMSYALDGLNTLHWSLYGACERCGEEYVLARLHSDSDGKLRNVLPRKCHE